ncbi:MAG: hypothetical protein ACR2QF_05910 [Geminicoccaceae bacterium]
MLRKSVILAAVAIMLGACGHTPEERLVSGALIGGLVGATVGVVSDPYYNDHHYSHRRHHHHRHHGYY